MVFLSRSPGSLAIGPVLAVAALFLLSLPATDGSPVACCNRGVCDRGETCCGTNGLVAYSCYSGTVCERSRIGGSYSCTASSATRVAAWGVIVAIFAVDFVISTFLAWALWISLKRRGLVDSGGAPRGSCCGFWQSSAFWQLFAGAFLAGFIGVLVVYFCLAARKPRYVTPAQPSTLVVQSTMYAPQPYPGMQPYGVQPYPGVAMGVPVPGGAAGPEPYYPAPAQQSAYGPPPYGPPPQQAPLPYPYPPQGPAGQPQGYPPNPYPPQGPAGQPQGYPPNPYPSQGAAGQPQGYPPNPYPSQQQPYPASPYGPPPGTAAMGTWQHPMAGPSEAGPSGAAAQKV
eukprot:tig00021489_g21654.t1